MRAYLILFILIILASAAMPADAQSRNKRQVPPYTAISNAPTQLQQRIDILSYDLTLAVDPALKAIEGHNRVTFRATAPVDTLVLDLDDLLRVSRVENGLSRPLAFEQSKGKINIPLSAALAPGETTTVSIFYGGSPHEAIRAPWDGGFVWSTALRDRPWVATAVQGLGCDMFWPCKDDVADKADTVTLRITVPKGLKVAANGVLQSVTETDTSTTFTWQSTSPINPYNISLNIGPFVRLQDSMTSVNGDTIPIEFWALPENRSAALALIENDLKPMARFFENLLGPYPWGNEKLGIVETPHLGMEHQTINAYGNKYRRDRYGYDWLLQHELSHEWFGNMLTHARNADFWLHEGFARYMQAVYAEQTVGKAGYFHYLWGDYLNIANCNPTVPDDLPPGASPDAHDVYNKGAWFLHTLRHAIGEAAFWRSVRTLLYGTPDPFALKAPIKPRRASTDDFIAIVNNEAGKDMQPLFDAILRHAQPPKVVEKNGRYVYQSASGVMLDLPVEVRRVGNLVSIDPDSKLFRALRPKQTCRAG